MTTIDSDTLQALRTWASEAGRLHALVADRAGPEPDPSVTALLTTLDVSRNLGDGEPPTGAVLVDAQQLAQLQKDADAGRQTRHDGLIRDAVNSGRIPPASVSSWRTLFVTDPASAEASLTRLRPNTIPVRAVGHSGDDEDRSLY